MGRLPSFVPWIARNLGSRSIPALSIGMDFRDAGTENCSLACEKFEEKRADPDLIVTQFIRHARASGHLLDRRRQHLAGGGAVPSEDTRFRGYDGVGWTVRTDARSALSRPPQSRHPRACHAGLPAVAPNSVWAPHRVGSRNTSANDGRSWANDGGNLTQSR